MTDLRKMSVPELIVATKSDPPDMLGRCSLEVIAELERRCAVPKEATYKEAPLSDMRGSIAWANGWNACLAKIKEMRDG